MRALIFFICLFFSLSALADEVRVEVSPQRPVAGEVFQVSFRIFTESNDEPSINFSPSGVEVVGKSNQGVSTRTIYANGRLTTSREVLVVYEMVAAKPGTSFIRDINVTVNGKSLRHNSLSLTVLKEPEQTADVFVMADASKQEIYIGEGITVRYYLYSKFPTINNLDIKKYPKLNNFLKRFLQEPDRTERVSMKGDIYLRTQIYAAKLFPEKVGTLKVDSLSLSATYPNSASNDPFGAFGLSRDYKTKTMQSEPVNIEVKPLPQPVPSHFVGLVGKHDFALTYNQQKLIVNEPLELKLTVEGPGALENVEPPTLIKHDGLEEFESTGDLKINDADFATKTFEYTFLAKQNLTIPASTVVLSYLDPHTGKYVPQELALPEITVAGGSNQPAKKDEPAANEPASSNVVKELPQKVTQLAGPILSESPHWSRLMPIINVSLMGIALALALLWLKSAHPQWQLVSQHKIPTEFRKGQFNFGDLARWMSPLILRTGKSPLLIIKESDLDYSTKSYFTDILDKLDRKEYANTKMDTSVNYQAAHFKKLAAYIEKYKNENHSEPT